jgi:hypothetical protein
MWMMDGMCLTHQPTNHFLPQKFHQQRSNKQSRALLSIDFTDLMVVMEWNSRHCWVS